MDVLQKAFVEGSVVLLKMSPVNEYLAPLFARALAPLIERNYLAIACGGAEVGSYLCYHGAVDDVHITGSNATHDRIVWGPPGSEREVRRRRSSPVLRKPITSELGNISPVLVVPGPYSDAELSMVAESVAGMMTHNASFNCNSAKLLVLPAGWRARDRFLEKLGGVLERVPPRFAYYPGAGQRFDALTRDRHDVRRIGSRTDRALPWTMILSLDPHDRTEPSFQTEPFCALLSEVSVGSDDPAEFLSAATTFLNERVWGTLNATVFVHPEVEASASGFAATQAALREMRYGTIALNGWAALGYALCSTPWGAYPGADLANVQSGIGWVHNTPMLEGIRKCIIRVPFSASPKPVYFPSHRLLRELGRRLADFEVAPSWLKVPGLAVAALRG
jgi:aldehyde dehydrogenase (NAD(P)+)